MIKMKIRIVFQETNLQLFLCHNLQNLISYFFGIALQVTNARYSFKIIGDELLLNFGAKFQR